MCGACGPAPSQVSWFGAGVGDDVGSRLRGRDALLRLTDELLDRRLLSALPQAGGPGLVLRTTDGRARVVDDPGLVWSAVAELTGCCVDPLGPDSSTTPLNDPEQQEGAGS